MVLVIIVRILTPKLQSRKTSDLLIISDPGTGDEQYAFPLIPHLPTEIKVSNLQKRIQPDHGPTAVLKALWGHTPLSSA